MSDLHNFKQSGNIYLWEYTVNTKNYPGYHMAWDSEGRESIENYLIALEKADISEFRTLTFSQPTSAVLAVPNNRDHKLMVASKVKIELGQSSDWKITKSDDIWRILIGKEYIEKILKLLPQVRSQNELSVGSHQSGNMLSFWW